MMRSGKCDNMVNMTARRGVIGTNKGKGGKEGKGYILLVIRHSVRRISTVSREMLPAPESA